MIYHTFLMIFLTKVILFNGRSWNPLNLLLLTSDQVPNRLKMVLFLADPSGDPINRIVLFLQNWTFLPITLIQVLHHRLCRGGGQNLVKPDDVILERSLILALETIAPTRWSAGQSPNDYNATAWPQLIIWDEDQMILDDQLGPRVTNILHDFLITNILGQSISWSDIFILWQTRRSSYRTSWDWAGPHSCLKLCLP